jgi:hypothetical protein
MTYISVTRFIRDAQAAVSASLKEVRADDAMGKLFGERLVRVFSTPVFSRAAIQMRSQLWTPGLMRILPCWMARSIAMNRSSSPAIPLCGACVAVRDFDAATAPSQPCSRGAHAPGNIPRPAA